MIKLYSTFNLRDREDQDYSLRAMIKTVAFVQQFLIMPPDRGLPLLKNLQLEKIDEKNLSENWDFTRVLQFWEMENNRLILLGSFEKTGDHFNAIETVINNITNQEKLKVWAAIEPDFQRGTLMLPEDY